jgi:hypothetical protein
MVSGFFLFYWSKKETKAAERSNGYANGFSNGYANGTKK